MRFVLSIHSSLPVGLQPPDLIRGLSRPSTSSLFVPRKDVDARHKAGHDEQSCPRPQNLAYNAPHPRSPEGALMRRRQCGAGSGAR
jgi:hypothetical protein